MKTIIVVFLVLLVTAGMAIAQDSFFEEVIAEDVAGSGGEGGEVGEEPNKAFQGRIFKLGEDEKARLYSSWDDVYSVELVITDIFYEEEKLRIEIAITYKDGETDTRILIIGPSDGPEHMIQVIAIGPSQALLVMPDTPSLTEGP